MIRKHPHGFSKYSIERCGKVMTAAGGTRRGIKLSRPWQIRLQASPSSCPFCNKDQEEIGQERNLRILKNKFTPFSRGHNLIIPAECPTTEGIWDLGGEQGIYDVLAVCMRLLNKNDRQAWLMAHVGWLGAQNVPHTHWHLIRPIRNSSPIPREQLIPMMREERKIYHNDLYPFTVFAGGVRAGQCFIMPDTILSRPLVSFRLGWMMILQLAHVIYHTIELCQERFQSVEGKPPDYQVGIVFRGKRFYFGTYIPILNHWGMTEYLAIMSGREPLILPWPHEDTAKHLRGE